MKIVTLFGTRPEIIRLSCVIKQLDRFCEQLLVYTGQNYDPRLSDIFFDELEVRAPNVHLGIKTSHFAEQIGQILERSARVFEETRPDRVLILGDTNSCLAAIVAARMGIPVYHMEAGNRCYDNRVPEEVNRRIVDHCSDVLMPYTQRSKDNLVREGIQRHRIYVTGNPIHEVLENYAPQIEASSVLDRFGVDAGQFFLVTLHRAENVDQPKRLENLLKGLALTADAYDHKMLVSLHPRTADKLDRFGLSPQSERVELLEPLGFFDFVKLEQTARCVLSDSGTVQEECCIFKVPSVTLRDVTERAETVECGSNMLTGEDPQRIRNAVDAVVSSPRDWEVPGEYLQRHVSSTVAKIVLGYHHGKGQ